MKIKYAILLIITLFLLFMSGAPYIDNGIIQFQTAHAFSVLEIPPSIEKNSFQDGITALNNGAAEDAVKLFEKTLNEEPLLSNYIHYYLAEAYNKTGNKEKALELFEKSAGASARNVSRKALNKILDISLESGRYDKALNACSTLEKLTANPENVKYLVKRAEIHSLLGNTQKAVEILLSAANQKSKPIFAAPAIKSLMLISPSSLNLLQSAETLYNAGDFLDAAELYEKILSLPQYKSNAKIMMQLGRSYERSDDFRTAIEVFKRVFELKSSIPKDLVCYRIGLCYQRIGENKYAEKWYQKVLDSSQRSSFTDDILFRIASMRDKKEKRQEAEAIYRRIANQFPRSSWADDALWKIGFGMLEDGKIEEARNTFKYAARKYPRSDYNSAFTYWTARSYEMEGNKKEALKFFKSVLKNNSIPYYRSKAISGFTRNGGTFTEGDIFTAILKASSADGDVLEALADLRAIRDAASQNISEKAKKEARKLYEKIGYWKDISSFSLELFDSKALLSNIESEKNDSQLLSEISRLIELGVWDAASEELSAIEIDAGPDVKKRIAKIRLLIAAERYRESMREAESLISTMSLPRDVISMPPIAARILYPRYYITAVKKASEKFGIDENFVLSVIREESRFSSTAVSSAGARGLMQIMPTTGANIAKNLDIHGYKSEDLFNPEINLLFGVSYLNMLKNLYDGKKYLMLAGYNAGPGNANRWLRQYSDSDDDLFIERISFKETRNYVKRVLGTYWIYQSLDSLQ